VSDQVLGRRLQWATILWNSAEVFITIGLGIAAGSLALVAFGLDSLIEVFASLVVLWHMNPSEGTEIDDTDGAYGAVQSARDNRARRLVALAFAVLAASLLVASTRALWIGTTPDSSPFGIAYLAITAVVMFTLARTKRRVGARLANEPFLAEAAMTLLDGFLAVGILTALILNTAFGWWWADPVAAIFVGLVAANEAREGLEHRG
jgi:divalent metal cation (Fe/Co/Zn/Cd) transporter